MKENDQVAEIKVEDASKCKSKVTYYGIWHKTDGVKWTSEVMFRTKEAAFDLVLRMPKHYEEMGQFAAAESWKNGEHVVVPIEIPVPNMEE